MVREKKLKLGPKKPATAFFCFTAKFRPQYKAENPTFSVTDLGRLFGEKWRALTDAEKEEYVELAVKDKARYQKEDAKWHKDKPEEVEAMANQKRKGREDKGQAKKKKTGPKHPLSAFMYFSTKTRPVVKAENPDIAFGDVAKKLGALWKTMTDDDKKEFNVLAAADKERYAREREEMEG